MKTISIVLFLLVMGISAFAQQEEELVVLTKEDVQKDFTLSDHGVDFLKKADGRWIEIVSLKHDSPRTIYVCKDNSSITIDNNQYIIYMMVDGEKIVVDIGLLRYVDAANSERLDKRLKQSL